MKTKLKLLATLLLLSTINYQLSTAKAQGTAFTYQGRLNSGTNPANGTYDFVFAIYGSPTGTIDGFANQTNSATPVSNGLFTVTLNLGQPGIFTGPDRWLEIQVRTNSNGAYTTLAPRQLLTPTPYAIYANTASNLSGTIANGALPPSPNFSGSVTGGSFSGSGANLTALNAGNIASGTLADARLSTNVALRSGGNTFAGDQFFNGAIYLNSTNGFDQSSIGNFYVDAPYIPGGRFAVLTNGNVGIDNPDPQYKLDVNGDMNLPLPATIYAGGTSFIHADGSANFFAGLYAGSFTVSGLYNVGIGHASLYYNTNGSYNTASGAYALFSNTRGVYNTANGYQTLYANVDGFSNTGLGYQALYSTTSSSGNTACGVQALYSNLGYNNTADGGGALQHNTYGDQNSATGGGALYSNTAGNDNTANGYSSLYSNTSGNNNVANGANALFFNTNGNYNTANGDSALYANSSGGYNTARGALALRSNTEGYNNSASGYSALFNNTSGSDNVAAGESTLYNNTNGNFNVAVGDQALIFNLGGNDNIAIGRLAGYFNAANGSSNIDIGSQGGPGDANVIRIGSSQVATYIAGISGATAASGVQVFVNSSGQLGTLSSSERFKQNIRSMGDASDVLLALRPVAFQYKPEVDPHALPQFGLIAEEVDKVDPDLVARDDNNQIYTVRYQAVDAMLLNEFLKEHQKLDEQKAEIQELKQSVSELKELVSKLAKTELQLAATK